MKAGDAVDVLYRDALVEAGEIADIQQLTVSVRLKHRGGIVIVAGRLLLAFDASATLVVYIWLTSYRVGIYMTAPKITSTSKPLCASGRITRSMPKYSRCGLAYLIGPFR